jgi:GT2 family glycosyltransferase
VSATIAVLGRTAHRPVTCREQVESALTSETAGALSTAPRVYVVLLNWNGCFVTLSCLESLFRQEHPNTVVVVCDNDSTDGSVEAFCQWARGELDVVPDACAALRPLVSAPVPKPVPHVVHDHAAATRGGDVRDRDAELVVVRTGGNLGCARGYNAGLRYALARGDADYVWVLNHDTIVHPAALTALVKTAQESPHNGLVGSTVRYFDAPDTLQLAGGCTFNLWFARGAQILTGTDASAPIDKDRVLREMAYVSGPSILVSRAFLEDVGLMSEDFFLYFEEISWAMRARGKYRLAYAPESVVYHRDGASTGDDRFHLARGDFTDFLMLRNRLVFARKFTPARVPTVMLGLAGVALESLLRRNWKRLRLFLRKDMWSGLPLERAA